MSIEMTNFSANNYEEAVQGIKQIKGSNQRVQKEKNKANIQVQKIMVREIQSKISGWLQKVEQGYLDPQTARKMKMIREQLKKQYEEHLSLVKEKQQDRNDEIRPIKNNTNNHNSHNHNVYDSNSESEGYLDMDFEMERKLMQKRNSQINQVHSNIKKVNSIIVQASELIYDQGQKLDMIEHNFDSTKQNVQASNKHLSQANEEQKKGNKNTLILVIIGIVILACCIGLLLFL